MKITNTIVFFLGMFVGFLVTKKFEEMTIMTKKFEKITIPTLPDSNGPAFKIKNLPIFRDINDLGIQRKI